MAIQTYINFENNIGTENIAPPAIYKIITLTLDPTDTGTITSNNNISSDGSADDYGGTGHIVNTPAQNVFESTTDSNLRPSGEAINAGKTQASFSIDALGVSRPQGAAWDIGATEKVVTILTIKGSTILKGAIKLN